MEGGGGEGYINMSMVYIDVSILKSAQKQCCLGRFLLYFDFFLQISNKMSSLVDVPLSCQALFQPDTKIRAVLCVLYLFCTH